MDLLIFALGDRQLRKPAQNLAGFLIEDPQLLRNSLKIFIGDRRFIRLVYRRLMPVNGLSGPRIDQTADEKDSARFLQRSSLLGAHRKEMCKLAHITAV